MAGVLDTYGYRDSDTGLVTIKAQEEYKQSAKDSEQDTRIQKNYSDNIVQQDEIDWNSLMNDAQEAMINELNDKIEHITSGGTIEDLDMGGW